MALPVYPQLGYQSFTENQYDYLPIQEREGEDAFPIAIEDIHGRIWSHEEGTTYVSGPMRTSYSYLKNNNGPLKTITTMH